MGAYGRLKSKWRAFREAFIDSIEVAAEREFEQHFRPNWHKRFYHEHLSASFSQPHKRCAIDHGVLRVKYRVGRGVTSAFHTERPGSTHNPPRIPAVDDLLEGGDQLWRHVSDEPRNPDADRLQRLRNEYADEWEVYASEATWRDFVRALTDDGSRLAAAVAAGATAVRVYPDEIRRFSAPGGVVYRTGHDELDDLLNHPKYTLRYWDNRMALIHPEGEHGSRKADEAFVVGEDDTGSGVFIHPVDAHNLYGTPSKSAVLAAMGFDHHIEDLDTDPLNPEKGVKVRVQGDLAVERVAGADEAHDSLVPSKETTQREVIDQTLQEIVDEKYPEWFTDAFRVRLSPHIDPEVAFSPDDARSCVIDVDCETDIQEVLPRLERFTGIDSSFDGLGKRAGARLDALTSIVAHDIEAVLAADSGMRSLAEEHHSNRVERALADVSQCNLPIDNHLILLHRAAVRQDDDVRTEPIRVYVPSETPLHVLHDEHRQVDVQIAPGTYRFFLLPRGERSSYGNRPRW